MPLVEDHLEEVLQKACHEEARCKELKIHSKEVERYLLSQGRKENEREKFTD